MTNIPKSTGVTKRSVLYRIGQVFSIASILAVIFLIFTTIIFWDAPHREARIRVEQIKHAWFGDWVTDEDLKPEKESVTGQIPDALKDASGITFFRQEKVDRTHLVVSTGTSFQSLQHVLDNQPEKQWCYISPPSSGVTKHVPLGRKTGDGDITYADLGIISPSILSDIGLSAERLSVIARSHCQFGEFNRQDN